MYEMVLMQCSFIV